MPELIIESDVSWGATLSGQQVTTEGLWSVNEQDYYINCLELLAAAMAVKIFAKDQKNATILLQHTNQDLHQPFWGDTFTSHEFSGSGVIEMVHRETDFPDSRAPPGREQPYCRYRDQNCEGQL